jgi:hypothetical protein
MTITAYQVDSVLNAYTRQSKVRIAPVVAQEGGSDGKYRDTVSLTGKDEQKAEQMEKISYNLRDVILREK